jgi:predicted dehydrogenase
MIKIALIGACKKGVSHLFILGASPNVRAAGVCDPSKIFTDLLSGHGKFNRFDGYSKMMAETKPDAAVVAVPTKFHYSTIILILLSTIFYFTN